MSPRERAQHHLTYSTECGTGLNRTLLLGPFASPGIGFTPARTSLTLFRGACEKRRRLGAFIPTLPPPSIPPAYSRLTTRALSCMRKRRDRLAIWHLLQLRVGPVAREPEAGPGPDALLEQHRDSVDAKEGDDTLRADSLWICA